MNLPYLAGRLEGIAAMVEIGAADNAAVARALREIAADLLLSES